jgi:hypothetical protein
MTVAFWNDVRSIERGRASRLAVVGRHACRNS